MNDFRMQNDLRQRVLIWVCSIGLLFALFGGTALADYDRAKRDYDNLNLQTRAKIILGLISTGDYDGLAVFGFTKRFYRSAIAFQKREGLRRDGAFDPDELELLVRRYQQYSVEAGIAKVRHPTTGSEMLMPRSLFDSERSTTNGVDYERNDGGFLVSFAAFAHSERSYKNLYESYISTSDGRVIEYKTFKPEYFVVSGLIQGKHFYLYMASGPTETVGFFVEWRMTWMQQARKASVLMANTFTLSGDGLGAPEQGGQPPQTAEVQPPPAPPAGQQQSPPPPPGNSTGTGFRITEAGHVVTNFHVAGQCKKIRLHRLGEPPIDASLVARDEVNDLALVKAAGPLPGTIAKFSGKGAVRVGSEIVVFGFPLTGLLSDAGNVTTGNITAMAGLGNDSRMYQISAPVQPGNSGGPVLDRTGAVAAVIVSKLNAMRVANQNGDVPQNVNFAIKTNVALAFIDGIGLPTEDQAKEAVQLDTPTLAEQAKAFTFLIECNND